MTLQPQLRRGAGERARPPGSLLTVSTELTRLAAPRAGDRGIGVGGTSPKIHRQAHLIGVAANHPIQLCVL